MTAHTSKACQGIVSLQVMPLDLPTRPTHSTSRANLARCTIFAITRRPPARWREWPHWAYFSPTLTISARGRFFEEPQAILHAVWLLPIAKFLKSGGKGYEYSEGDGVYYSYSIFSSLPVVRAKFPIVHQLNTSPASVNLIALPRRSRFSRGNEPGLCRDG